MKNTQKSYLGIMPVGIFALTIILLSQSFCSVATPRQIVGMSVAPSNNWCYTWYDDNTVSMGDKTDTNVDAYSDTYYSLPAGKSVHSIVSMSIDADGRLYTWYNDKTVSVGDIFQLDAHKAPYYYSLPQGKSVRNIVGMGISANNDVYTWYEGGIVSVGTPDDLGFYNAPYAYPLPQEKSANNLVGINIPHNNDYVYAWYRGTKSSYFDYNDNYSTSNDHYTRNMPSDANENLQFTVSEVPKINSMFSDFAPSFYENQLMFSTFRKGNGNSRGNSNQIYISMRSGEKLYRPQPLRKGYRAVMSNESDPSFTEDGQQVAYVRNKNFANGTLPHMGNMDIHLADAVSQNDWRNKKSFSHNNKKYSNGYPHLTAGGDVLYFASNMPGGYGGFDIYVCKKIGNRWSEPINLGAGINTKGDEISPFLAERTLYFASDSHDGRGGFDIFKSIYGNKGWKQAVNMGEAINSFYDDYDFIYEPYENIAYFTSNRAGGLGDDDIYQATAERGYASPRIKKKRIQSPPIQSPQPLQPDVVTPNPVVIVVKDEKTKQALASVQIETTCDGKIYTTDASGIAVLETFDRACNIHIGKNGYETNKYRFPTQRRVNIELSPVKYAPVVHQEPVQVSTPERAVLVVRDSKTKQPIEGVQIDLTNCNAGIYTTNSDGLVILERFGGNCTIRISKSGYEKHLHSFPTMAQLGVELKPLGGGHTGVILELQPDPVYIAPNSVKAVYPSNKTSISNRPFATHTSTTAADRIDNNREIYEVQIGAYRTPHPELSQRFKSLGRVYFHMKNDMMVYKVGSFKSYNDAEYARAILSSNGFPDAFIKKTLLSGPAAYAPPPVRSVSTNRIVYKIQLGAFRDSGNATFNPNLEYFGNIQKTTRADGITVFLLGDFYSMTEATTAQKNAINLGISKAFIVKYRNGVRVKD